MANLLPENFKKENRQEFFYRKLTIVAITALALIVVGCVLMLTIYFYLVLGGPAHADKGKILTELSLTDQGLVKEAEVLNEQLKFLKPDKETSLPSEIFTTLVEERKPGISIHHLALECPLPSASCNIAVLGRADNRQSLLDYVQVLKEKSLFSKVQSPINNLISDKDSQFTLELETIVIDSKK